MRLDDRVCPRQHVVGTLERNSTVESIVGLLETLMMPVSVDAVGNMICWIHTPLGQQVVLDSFAPSARRFWVPAVMRAAGLWQALRKSKDTETIQ